MAKVRAILFDLEPALVSFPHFTGGARRALFDAGAARVYAFLYGRKCSLPRFNRFLNHQRRMAQWIGWRQRFSFEEPDPRRFLRRMCVDYGLQRDDTALGTLGWLWHGPRAEMAIVEDDVHRTLATLRDSGIKLGLIVNTPLLGRVVDQHLAKLGLLEFFSARVYSSEIGARMPDSRFFQAALDELKVSAHEAAIVSAQRKAVLIPASRMGMTAILKSDDASDAQAISHLAQLPALLDTIAPAPTPSAQPPALRSVDPAH